MSIGSRIRKARKDKKLTQSQLAAQCGITKGAISNYENDVSTPDIEKLSIIMSCLEVDPNYIYQDYFSEKNAPALSASDEALLYAYHRASVEDRQIIDNIVSRYAPAASSRDARIG